MGYSLRMCRKARVPSVMNKRLLVWAMVSLVVSLVTVIQAQEGSPGRLPKDAFDVRPPSDHVSGPIGRMRVAPQDCRVLPTEDVRRRIVDVAVQEWAYFGFLVTDQNLPQGPQPRAADESGPTATPSFARRRSRLSPEESARVAATIAGYWAVTPEGAWIVDNQNDNWNGPRGAAARWNAPWSAAFISWVMCEGGLGSSAQFHRAVAHHTYIDQSIRARDGRAPEAGFEAFEVGEHAVSPGDLLCSGRRPEYQTVAERRRQLGVGARSHCDVVVRIDDANEQILTVGGNVRGVVSLKVFPGVRGAAGRLQVRTPTPNDRWRPIFAHLRLRASEVEANALDNSPTMRAAGCVIDASASVRLVAARIPVIVPVADRC